MAAFFLLTWFVLLFYAVRLISRGWSAASEMDGRKVIKEKTTFVTKTVHPEMEEVEVGDELLVVRFDEPKKEQDPRFKLDSPALHNLDPLQQSLRDRINELNEDDDDDDDGGIISRA
tara:strand:- start:6 stop:356 length:351 start_codon:yes stop_codon:yes gene_type:complete